MPGIATLTTDFGTDGPYVAAMKGVLLGLAPGTQVVDVCHTISPQNIVEGAFVLAGIVDAFPAGTVHLVVIDPGVGTDRRLIAARAADQWFVLPDNGLISGVTRLHEPEQIWEIKNPAVRRAVVSNTFHGRDILAPAAAHLLLGREPSELGPPVSKLVRLRNLDPTRDAGGFQAEVIFRDTFGNLITNVGASLLADCPPDGWVVEVAGRRIEGLSRTYGDQPSGSLIALVGSSGWVEVAVVDGDAGRLLTAGPGTSVWIRNSKSPAPPHAALARG
ncbi:Adenosyl-chloride synthase [Aquisphaera giovannonii]|uniref:Adenosyl-chloride synthase n=1 Tax=Aquisphaera giovannonii TaxID=406548 RepID=A0A5B9WDE0_9BACT|nr:SAM-dependent chlorinase/fluorinase [Aquisphaera giovannonii]QEH38249.1 Adenosyl-chloride synthase [Aquisphaera giovannonii]